MGVTKAKQVVVLECAHEGCTERHLLKPGTFTIVRGREGEGAKGYGIKRTKADDIFSRRIRARDGLICQRCGKGFASNSMGLHSAHCFGRARESLYPGFQAHTGWGCCPRHDPENAVALCWRPCHDYLDDHETEKHDFFRERLGVEAFEALEERAKALRKRVPRRVS